MKKYLLGFALSALMGIVTATAQEEKTETILGKAECAKCSLKQTDACQMHVTTKDGKKYLVENNDVSKKFHKEICQDEKEVEVTGTVAKKDGKNILTAKKIDLAKKS